MKKLAVCAVAVLASIGTPVFAADMAVKALPIAPPASNWTGFYIGGFAGGAWAGSVQTTDPCLTGTACPPAATFDGANPVNYNIKASFVGGGTIGYNWQISPSVVIGLENKLGYLHAGSTASLNVVPFPQISVSTNYGNWFDAYVGRIGATNGRLMIFAEGGGATARVSTGFVDTVTPITLTISTSKTVTSWAAGGGLEYALDKNWSVVGEVLELGLRNTITGCGTASSALVYCSQSKLGGVTLVDLGIDYSFK